MHDQINRLLVATVTVVILNACASYGPQTLSRDQMDYGDSIGDSWKIQMLSNLVKLRYLDMPVFVEVGQIVSGYTLETEVRADVGFSNSIIGNDTQGLGASGRYTDRPTITYRPKTGTDFLRSLLVPVNPASLLSLIQAGYSPELLFTWGVESINGVKNYSNKGTSATSAEPEFIEFVKLLAELQQQGAIGFELDKDPETRHDLIFFFSNRSLSEDVRIKRERAGNIIGLKPGLKKFRVLYSPFALEEDVLAIQTRSVLQMHGSMSSFVDIPADKSGRALAGHTMPVDSIRPFHVRTSKVQPEDPFASFLYHGDWYWIDHEDIKSKQVFLLMLFLTTLTNSGSNQPAPVLTIPTS
jgi:hypothetical protein